MPASVLMVGGMPWPFAILKVEMGLRKQTWQIAQAALGSVGASSTWRGQEIDASGVTVTSLIVPPGFIGGIGMQTVAVEDADEAARLHIEWIKRIHPGIEAVNPLKPPVWDCDHPIIRARFARKLSHLVSGTMPGNEHATSWYSIVGLVEAKPIKRVPVSAPDPAKLNNNDVPAASTGEKLLQQLLGEVAKG